MLSFSPGRIDPSETGAWTNGRKPLVGEFTYRGKTLFVIANHFNSKGGDDPLFGHFQPPSASPRCSGISRPRSSTTLSTRSWPSTAPPTSSCSATSTTSTSRRTVTILKGGVLHNLMDDLVPAERYSYVFEGNSQVLDQILVSNGLDIAEPGIRSRAHQRGVLRPAVRP